MGAEVLLVGLAPALSREFVLAGMPFIKELKCFLDFRTALQHLMSVKGLAITKKDPPSERI
jgi:rsbT co-antagonist protein RsbR